MEGILAIIFIFGGGTLFLLATSPIGKAIAERIRNSGPAAGAWTPNCWRKWTACGTTSPNWRSGWTLRSAFSRRSGRASSSFRGTGVGRHG